MAQHSPASSWYPRDDLAAVPRYEGRTGKKKAPPPRITVTGQGPTEPSEEVEPDGF
jgi:hypothetical protein